MAALSWTPGASLSAELSTFAHSVSRRNFTNAPELCRIGLVLLRKFPAARAAVLDYLSCVLADAACCSLSQPSHLSQNQDYNNEPTNTPSQEAAAMVGPELCTLGESWAPIIAPWCISLLKDIATGKSNVSTSALQSSDPIRALLDIATTNLTRLTGEERAKCIDMLLDCRECDWVVGHVARCDPSLIVPRALRPGLDNEQLLANMEHVVGIMNHLPPTHTPHIRDALLHLFNEAISPENKRDKKKYNIIPYLLNLASKSDSVLKAMTHNIDSLLTENIVDSLTELSKNSSWESVSVSLMVSLLLRAEVNSFLLLLKYYKNTYCRQLLEHMLQKLEYDALFSENKIPLLTSVAEEMPRVRSRFMQGNQIERYSITRVLILVGHQLPSEFVNTIGYLLQFSRNDTTLALLVRIISGTLAMHTPSDSSEGSVDTERYQKLINTAVEFALRDAMMADFDLKKIFLVEGEMEAPKTYLHNLCANLTTLLRWENSNKVSHLRNRPISKACDASLFKLGCAFDETVSLLRLRSDCTMSSLDEAPTCRAIAGLLDIMDMSGSKSPAPSVDAVMKLTQASVKYFFRCLQHEDKLSKMQGTATACRLLRKLCIPSKVARSIALRELLETALFREEEIFGGRAAAGVQDKLNNHYLIHLNRKHGPISQLTQSHTSVFHAGIIGRGAKKRKSLAETNTLETPLSTEIELLMAAIMSCMEGNGGVVEGMTSVSLLLVELVSPDVMYNGLPWPDEDFTKVSIERELYMRNALENCYVARCALRRAASARPALCYASALLRAVAATLLHQHRATDDRYVGAAESNKLYLVTTELLETMVLGQLLPHPLNYIMEMLPHLKPHEIVQVLRDCIWNYTRDHVPSPALFKCDSTGLYWREPSSCKPPAAYTDTLRIIIQKNIGKLGHLYPLMFLGLEKADN